MAALILLLLVLLGAPATAVGQVAAARVEVGWMPLSSVSRSVADPATEARASILRGSVFLPLILQGGGTTFVPRLSAGRVGITPRPVDPTEPVWVEALYDVDLELILRHTVGQATALTLVVSPGAATDGRDVSADDLTLQGAALLTRDWSEAVTWGTGVSLSNAFGEVQVFPLLVVTWAGARGRADFLLPARAEVYWTPEGPAEVGVRAAVDGNVYRLGRRGALNDGIVRYSVIDVGPVLNVRLAGALGLELAAGASLRRRLEIEDAAGNRVQDAALRRGWHLQAAFTWWLETREVES